MAVTLIHAEATDELLASLCVHNNKAFNLGTIKQQYPIWDKNGKKYQDIAEAYLTYYKEISSYRREEFCGRLYFKRFTLYPHLVTQITNQGGLHWFSGKSIPDNELPDISNYSLRRKLISAYKSALDQPPHRFIL
jgi:hypothetical protein